jgi:hypothetical protein
VNAKVPTLYEWLGGGEVLDRLIARFYERVPADPLLAVSTAVDDGRPMPEWNWGVPGGAYQPADSK